MTCLFQRLCRLRTGTGLNRSFPSSYSKPLPRPHHPPTNKQATSRLRLLLFGGQRHKHQHNKRRGEWLLLPCCLVSPLCALSLSLFLPPKLFSSAATDCRHARKKVPSKRLLAACLLPARRLLRESCPVQWEGRRQLGRMGAWMAAAAAACVWRCLKASKQ